MTLLLTMLFSKITAEVGLTSAWIIIPVFIGPVIEVWGDDKIGVQGSVGACMWMQGQVEGKVLLKINENPSIMYYFGPSYYLLFPMGDLPWEGEAKQIGRQGIGITIGLKRKAKDIKIPYIPEIISPSGINFTFAFGSLFWFRMEYFWLKF